MNDAGLNPDVQAELHGYMEDYDLNTLFASMVEAVLMDKPKKPHAFLVSYLLKNFSDQIDLEALGLRRTGGDATGAGGRSGHRGSTAPLPKSEMKDESGDESEEASDDSDDDDDDVIDELPAFSASATRRRESVSAEASVDPRALKARWEAEKKVYPKSDNDRRRLRGILLENMLFQRLDEEQLEIVLDALSPVAFADGKTIIKQGTAGDLFYVVESGAPEVFVEANGKSTKVRCPAHGGCVACLPGHHVRQLVEAGPGTRHLAVHAGAPSAVCRVHMR